MKMKTGRLLTAVLCVLFAGLAGPASAQSQKLPVDAFALEPVIENVRVSPDGKHIAMLMLPGKNQKPYLAIYRTDSLGKDPVRIASGKARFIEFFWGNNERIVVTKRHAYPRMSGITNQPGYAHWLGSVDVRGKNPVELPDRTLRSERSVLRNWMQIQPTPIISRLPDDDDHILIEFNRNPDRETYPDIYRINIANGKLSKVANGNPRLGGYMADRKGNLRFASGFDFSSFQAIFYMREANGETWDEISRFGIESHESFDIVGDYLDDPDKILVTANNGGDRVGLWAFNTRTKKIENQIFAHPRVDVSNVKLSTKRGEENKIAGYIYTEDIPKVQWVDANEKALHDRINAALPGTWNTITSRSKDDRFITVLAVGPKEPGAHYLLKNGSQMEFLGRERPMLTPDLMGDVRMIRYKARDGLEIPAYLTTPPAGKPPYPGIVMPHGGPWSRDNMLFDPWVQFLAHNGYAVLQPQFRGSTGFGIKLWRAGDAQWGLTMQDDLEDGMKHLVSQGIVARDRMAIFGWSYGGYAAMVAATRNPNIFQCSIPGAGVSDITDLRAGLSGSSILRRIQRPTIKGVSPVQKVADVNIPVLVIHGDRDQRVRIEQSQKFVDGLKRHNKPHKFVVLEGADHFYGTIFYEHFSKMYGEMLTFLQKDCGPGGL
jgi:dipeptidyl aminopeptidase/acylaminoacyl peptidase